MATNAGVWTFRLIMAVIVLAVVATALWVAWKVLQRIKRNIAALVQPVRDTRTWKERFSDADASHQALLLRQVSAEQLGFKPEEFLEFLADTCRPLLKHGDPPQSDFWRKWQEANDLARLEREEK